MARTAAQRIAQYNARMAVPQIVAARVAINTLMQTNFAAYANHFVPLQEACSAQLAIEGVPVSHYFGYHGFNNEMLRIWRNQQGASRDLEVCILINKYTALGLLTSVLQNIVLNVWAVPAVNICIPNGCGAEASAYSPETGTLDVPVDGTLSWLLDPRATSVDVYLDDVNPPVTQVVTAGRVLSYDYTGLPAATPHFWRVDVTYDDFANPGSPCVVEGVVQTFTTA